ncbi:nuclear protein 1 [Sorex araneus]|uniref:nuclear protein 1 n=1 Tax=Sorex araneus TaxID=42254 RepID=UPI002433A745|nr:nuclear protein 1 [Sorex araneus]
MTAASPPGARPCRPPVGPEEEDVLLDEYDRYGLCHPHLGAGGSKGRTKREAAARTNRPSPGGHERKLVTKLQNTERKRLGARP